MGGHRLVPRLGGELVERAEGPVGGVADEVAQRPEGRDGVLDEGGVRGRVRRVGLEEGRPAPHPADLPGHGLGRVPVLEVAQRDVRALGGQAQGARPADAARASRDQGGAAEPSGAGAGRHAVHPADLRACARGAPRRRAPSVVELTARRPRRGRRAGARG
ncbi:MAG: hypothetical protein AVDCRST_MAG13-2758 [uncultured Solirubrobacteraceae bacterium]|uniref:Uncharacterized protein n=1 Tax=uncultured Solirubrobacteraceae bacterium TaxID=1162706 RepID=A0A6J4T0S9_9ACTN|nr:MAG: hypothetical protein AVDCRST_MAG13-2758 [uncultured Solirubrobacteraceae bacterium]